ncbi:ABC transporter permease [Paenibacillus lautus]|jgi:putative aldouronate transport system permease protein|uniref:Sugar ABC transporter permease n=1 Tax=Paenibacillus lautus TaxID=1401 RepID=A0A385TQC4_PAELA|nr:ABC transporter permease subunit [Paenibacillus lautus]MBY0164340.1 sugar ABC transporter permease [Cytobacillus firmus]VTR61470.1 sn-glycerol-3-phosphate transport system permease protein ugpA [Actinobacillus pleuropneumoniae]AYB46650.1 sugar ABC transporter permease [Paenibacillus lautus]MCI1775456.1 ABC transporter permease subunit [Paenibacillus lautus]MCM3262141.1 ABC transporter permease subunit [Paenibacillus lautus]
MKAQETVQSAKGSGSPPIPAKSKTKWGRIRSDVARDKYLYMLALPGLIFFIIFKYIPITNLVIAFQEYSPYFGVFGSPWVGFEHFARFFSNDDFWMLLRNTLAISFLSLIFFFPAPIILALMLNEVRSSFYKRTIQSLVYIPHFLSWVLIYGLTYLMFSQSEGLFNKWLVTMDWGTVDILSNPNYFWGMLTAQSIWKEVGWGTIIFLAAIAGVDPQLYEAAVMDGAGRMRRIWHITLPAMRNVILILLILRLGTIMDTGFEQIYLMMNAPVTNVAEVFDTYVYRVGIRQGEFSYSTAIGLFKSIVGVILVVSANRLARRYGQESLY